MSDLLWEAARAFVNEKDTETARIIVRKTEEETRQREKRIDHFIKSFRDIKNDMREMQMDVRDLEDGVKHVNARVRDWVADPDWRVADLERRRGRM